MSLSEVVFRIKEEIRKTIERQCFRDIEVKRTVLDKKVNWYFDFAAGDRIVSFIKEHTYWKEGKSQDITDHRLSFFSLNNKWLGEKIDWHLDYKNNQTAPLSYSKSINYRDFDKLGDIKYIWEINRHLHLVSPAKAYYLTGKQDYKNGVISQINSWMAANPYRRGVNWSSSLELGIRLISWSWVYFFIKELDKDFKQKWLGCIHKHCNFISKNYSRYSSANNHLIGEAAGLFIASIVWPFEKESKMWRDKSYKILVEEIEKQNFEDGVNKEQAIAYQQFVLDFFLLAGLLGEKNGIAFPRKYWHRIERMMEYVASLMDVQGNVPNIGDADDGYAVTLSDEECFNPYRSLLATGAALFKRGDFKRKARRFDDKSLWLLGMEGYEQFNSLKEEKCIPIKDFDQGGYFIFSTFEDTEDEIKGIVDCGPLGYLSLAAHGHSDALSFILSTGGKKFLIDPGTYAYHTQIEWRDYFKGTSAHNTIRIDGVNQSVSGGNFMWLKKARVKLLLRESNEDYDLVMGEHDGYSRLRDPVMHRRDIFFDKKNFSFKIIDKINAREKHVIEQFFHFYKDCQITKIQDNEWEIRNGGKVIQVKVDNKLCTEIVSGSVKPILGWQSERFDVKEATNTMVNRVEWDGACEFVTLITIKR